MPTRRQALRIALTLALFAAGSLAVFTSAAQSPYALLGSWDVTLHTPRGEQPAWLRISGISDDPGTPRLEIVGPVGSVVMLKNASIHNTDLQFTVTPQDDIGLPGQVTFVGSLRQGALTGTAQSSGQPSWPWSGVRAPALARSAPPHWSAPIPLFNGHDLTGWTFHDSSHPGTWTVADNILTSIGQGSDLVSTRSFQDFQLHLEVNAGPGSNSGVYLRGRYEIQIETDSAAEPLSHHTAGLYGFLAPTPEQPRRPDAWQTLDITLVGRTLTVLQNGITVIDHKTVPGITGGALDSHEAAPGPIVLQGSEPGRVLFRNITVCSAVRP